jgi:hypothetical protein
VTNPLFVSTHHLRSIALGQGNVTNPTLRPDGDRCELWFAMAVATGAKNHPSIAGAADDQNYTAAGTPSKRRSGKTIGSHNASPPLDPMRVMARVIARLRAVPERVRKPGHAADMRALRPAPMGYR